jgi:ATP-dependent protease ClpP protease subunit
MSNDFEGIIQSLSSKTSQLITRTLVSNEYSLYIHGVIGSADDFMEHFAVLKQASPNDVVNLYINTPGGNLATAIEIMDHMADCQAPILGVIGMDCASAGTAIALSCDGWKLSEFSTFMIHSFSYGAYGHATAVETQGKHNSALNERFVRRIYDGFLTEEEMLDVIKGVDMFIGSDDLAERLDFLGDYRDMLEREGKETENYFEEIGEDKDDEFISEKLQPEAQVIKPKRKNKPVKTSV